MLDEIVDVLPSPARRATADGRRVDGNGGSAGDVPDQRSAASCALVFKTVSEQHLGDLSLVRIYSGHARVRQGAAEHGAQPRGEARSLYHLVGKERVECKSAKAGDIVAAVKLRRRTPGDTLADKSRAGAARAARCSRGRSPKSAIRAKNKGRRGEDGAGARRACTKRIRPFVAHYSRPSTKETLVRGMGDLQLEVMVDRLEEALRRRGRAVEAARARTARPSRGKAAGRVPPQEADRRPRAVRRGAPAARAAAARRRVRVRRRGEGRRGPEPVHSRGREGRASRRWSAGPLAGYPVVDVQTGAVLRQVPRRRLVGNGVQDRGRELLPPGDAGGAARACSSRSARSRCACPRSSSATSWATCRRGAARSSAPRRTATTR